MKVGKDAGQSSEHGSASKLTSVGNTWPLWIVVIVLAAIPTVYVFGRWTGHPIPIYGATSDIQSFLDGLYGSWFATIMGLAAGVPIGLWINYRQQLVSENLQKTAQAKISRDHTIKVLNVIKSELVFNRDILTDLIAKDAQQPGIVYTTGMKDVLWGALSDGGELQWINDLDLLDKLADAYYHIRAVINLEKHYFEPGFDQSVLMQGNRTTYGERTMQAIVGIRPGVLGSIEAAIAAIDSSLARNE